MENGQELAVCSPLIHVSFSLFFQFFVTLVCPSTFFIKLIYLIDFVTFLVILCLMLFNLVIELLS
jgi:hypothetical protein